MQAQGEQHALPMTNFRPPQKRASEEGSTPSDSLPSINSKSLPKANAIRNEVNASKLQILHLEAKLNHLRKVKEQNEMQNQRNLTKINFVNSIKQRVQQDHDQKQHNRKERDESLQSLKNKVGSNRRSLKSDLEQARQKLQRQKDDQANAQRRKHKQMEYLIQKCREIEQNQNMKKVQRVREDHETTFSRVMDFKVDRVASSKDNYKQKVDSTLKQRDKASSVLQKLKEEEQRLIADVRKSESLINGSRVQLSTLNPEKRRKRSTRSERHMKSNASLSHQMYTLEVASGR